MSDDKQHTMPELRVDANGVIVSYHGKHRGRGIWFYKSRALARIGKVWANHNLHNQHPKANSDGYGVGYGS